MKTRNSRNSKFVLMLAVAAIGGAPVLFGAAPPAQPAPPAAMPADMRPTTPIESSRLAFRYWSKIKGDNIYSVRDDKNLGDIQDALISRGGGRIDYLIVKTDTTLGLGGRLVLVPYDQLSFRDGDRHEFRLDATQDQMKGFTEFTAQGWRDIDKPNAAGSKTLAEALARQAARERQDPYANKIDSSQRATTIDGKITDIDRRYVSGVGDQVVITVQDDAGKKQEVALGPAWFAMGGDHSPARGQRVRVSTLRTNTGEAVMVAVSGTVDGNNVRYRTDAGEPNWTTTDAPGVAPSRYVLATEITGKEVEAAGSRCGKIDDPIVERTSGQIAFLVIDPDQNFLGIGDTKRLVPFGVATARRGDGKIALDASKDMVLASSPAPKTLDELRSDDFRKKAYAGFQVNPHNFMARERAEWK